MSEEIFFEADTLGNAADFTVETGYASGTYPYGGKNLFPWDISELNPILSWPGNTRIYAQMRHDSQISAATRAVHSTIRKVDFRIDPAGADMEFVQALANDLGLPIIGSEQSNTPEAATVPFRRHLAEALEVTTYGHMPFEITVTVDGPIVRLAHLNVRHPQTITRIIADAQGNISEVWQAGVDVLPGARLCWYRVGGLGATPQGVSLLRSAYRAWTSRDKLERVLLVSAERNGLGMPIAEMNGEATKDEMEAAAQIAESVRAGEFAGVAIKNGTLRFRGVEGTTHDTLADIKYQNGQIAKSMLEMFLELGTASTGSHALGEVQIDLFRDSCQALANDLAEQFTDQVIRRLAEWTYGAGAKVPRLVAGQIGTDENLAPAMLSMFVQSGVVTADTGLEVHIRQQYGLPEMDSDTEHVIPNSGMSVKTLHAPPVEADQPGAPNF